MIGLKKTRATYSTNQMLNQNQSRLGRTRFPALLGTGYVNLLWVLIGSYCCLRLLWLASVTALFFVSRPYTQLKITLSNIYQTHEIELKINKTSKLLSGLNPQNITAALFKAMFTFSWKSPQLLSSRIFFFSFKIILSHAQLV